MIVSIILLKSPSAKAEVYGGVEFPLGAISFADEAVSFTPGEQTGAPYNIKNNALNVPDKNHVSLGNGGILVVKFTDNFLVDTDGDDLYVFEYGDRVEAFKVEISKDQSNWIDLGVWEGQPLSLDISDKINPGDKFSYVRLTDANKKESRFPTGGADIDAIGAIGTEAVSSLQTIPTSFNEVYQTSEVEVKANHMKNR